MTAPTRITCPHCLGQIDLVQHVREQTWRALYLELGALGSSWPRAFAYVQLCRKSDAGRAPVKTMTSLAAELKTIWRAGRFFYAGAEHHISRAQLVDGMEACIEKGLSGLKNNNYLKQILIGKARETRREEGKAEAGRYRDQAEKASARPAAEPTNMRGESVTDQPPEKLILSLARAYKSRMVRDSMPHLVSEMEAKLEAAGVNLDKLQELARKAQNLDAPGLGSNLLRKCQTTGERDGKNN